MRAPTNWDIWLTEYDQAATRAEALAVAEALQTDSVVTDFLGAVSKTAPAWVTTFAGPGYDKATIDRKKMMKLFRDHMSQFYPTKGKLKSAFAAGEASYVTGGASDQDTSLRDASDVCERAPSARTGSRGNPRQNKRKHNGHSTRSKQSMERDTAAAGGNECPACGQRHRLSECYYVYADRAPDWFKPN